MTRTHPLLSSRFIGFDTLNDLLDNLSVQTNKSFPPFNLIQIDSDTYRIELAVAGFAQDALTITRAGDKLTISGTPPATKDEVQYAHRGIALRSFTREFHLAPYIAVRDAAYENGLLSIVLERKTPEALRPQTVPIVTTGAKDAQTDASQPDHQE